MKAFIPGRVFKNEKLYLFDNYGVTVMTAWPDIKAYRKTRTRPWRCFRPTLPLDEYVQTKKLFLSVPDLAKDAQQDALYKWGSAVPDKVSMAIAKYPNRHWHLLSLVARCGEPALDLIHSTPALAWMLASSWIFKNKPVCNHFRSIRNLFSKNRSQVDLLKWLDFPASKSIVKVLRKVHIPDIDATLLLNLKELLSCDAALKTLRHAKTINKWNLWLLSVNQKHHLNLSDALVTCAEKPISGHQRAKINDTISRAIDIKSQLNMTYPTIASFNQLEAYIDRVFDGHLMDEYYRQRLNDLPDRVFPWFPISLPAAFPQFALIDTHHSLVREAHKQHCVDTYVEQVLAGELFFFTFSGRQRMTLSIVWDEDCKTWCISEFAGFRNAKADKEDVEVVYDWLDEVNMLTNQLIANQSQLLSAEIRFL